MEKVIIHNKLIRDKIPDFLERQNITCYTKILNNQDYTNSLYKKLQEEVNELLASKNNNNWIEEMADILEVMLALLENKGFRFEQLEIIRKKKLENRGGFCKKLFLEKTVARTK